MAYEAAAAGMTAAQREGFDAWLVSLPERPSTAVAPITATVSQIKAEWGRSAEASEGLRLLMGGQA